MTELLQGLPPFKVAASVRGQDGFKSQIIALNKEDNDMTIPMIPVKVELRLKSNCCQLKIPLAACLLMSTEKDPPVKF